MNEANPNEIYKHEMALHDYALKNYINLKILKFMDLKKRRNNIF